MMAWESAGFKTASTSSTIPLTQQVFITAGLLILLGCTLTVLHGAIFIVIPGFVGGGLLFAGITGWCGMAVLLSKMPWNRK
jgi:hypothetical protein